MTRYRIGDGMFTKPIYVDIDGDPPCLYCGELVSSPSMDGPLVCGACDCGRNRDGTRWSEDRARERHAHFARMIATYRGNTLETASDPPLEK